MKFAQTAGNLQNKILLPVIALKIEPIDIAQMKFCRKLYNTILHDRYLKWSHSDEI